MKPVDEFDKENRFFDEGYPPAVLDKIIEADSNDLSSFTDEFFSDSYRLQVKTILDLNARSCIEFGPGEGFTQKILCDQMLYKTADLFGQPDFKVDLGRVSENFTNEKFDVSCAFQVLEHLPLSQLSKNLSVMKSVSNRWVCISLPYYRFGFSFALKLHLGQRKNIELNLSKYLPYPNKKNRKYRKQYIEQYPWAVHHFELGRDGVNDRTVIEHAEEAGLMFQNAFNSKNPFHRFFVFKCL